MRTKSQCLACAAAAILIGCGTTRELPPQVIERTFERVPVPVITPCDLDQKTKDERPKFLATNEELAAISDEESGSRLVKAALAQYIFWVAKLEEGFEICRRPR